MSTPFLGEIKIMSFNFPPKGWAFCQGQTLQISQNQALFGLLKTTYGGDGQKTFKLPDLQGKAALGQGNGFTMGQVGGEYSHLLTLEELPTHNHPMVVFATGPVTGPSGRIPGNNAPAGALAAPLPGEPVQIWGKGTNTLRFSPTAISLTGGNQRHDNQQPFLALSFCIALQGLPPKQ